MQLRPVQHEVLVHYALRPSQPPGAGSQRPLVPQRMPRQQALVALQVSLSALHVAGARQTAFTHTSELQQAAVAHEVPAA